MNRSFYCEKYQLEATYRLFLDIVYEELSVVLKIVEELNVLLQLFVNSFK